MITLFFPLISTCSEPFKTLYFQFCLTPKLSSYLRKKRMLSSLKTHNNSFLLYSLKKLGLLNSIKQLCKLITEVQFISAVKKLKKVFQEGIKMKKRKENRIFLKKKKEKMANIFRHFKFGSKSSRWANERCISTKTISNYNIHTL